MVDSNKFRTKLNESGLLLKTPSGYVQQSPLLGIVNNCTDTVIKLSREFGLTPSSRSRLQVTQDPGPETPLRKMMRELRENRGEWKPPGA